MNIDLTGRGVSVQRLERILHMYPGDCEVFLEDDQGNQRRVDKVELERSKGPFRVVLKMKEMKPCSEDSAPSP